MTPIPPAPPSKPHAWTPVDAVSTTAYAWMSPHKPARGATARANAAPGCCTTYAPAPAPSASRPTPCSGTAARAACCAVARRTTRTGRRCARAGRWRACRSSCTSRTKAGRAPPLRAACRSSAWRRALRAGLGALFMRA
ncbi:MAG: hypothetical protein M1826_003349, partial [Phylliscum demangeonii]